MLQFRMFGIPFAIHWFFWLVCLLLGGAATATTGWEFMDALVWTAVVFVSITIHELGHAFTCIRFGMQPMILLHGFGGLTLMRGPSLGKWRSILVSAAGPAAGFALWGVALIISKTYTPPSPLGRSALHALLFLNFFWTLFNLLPILPMDGGQIFRALLGPRNLKWARLTGGILASLLAIPAFLNGMLLMGIFLAAMAYGNFKDQPLQGGVGRLN
jgi:stage IV sporulation protein FB